MFALISRPYMCAHAHRARKGDRCGAEEGQLEAWYHHTLGQYCTYPRSVLHIPDVSTAHTRCQYCTYPMSVLHTIP
eukprot:3654975-Rhodomonas_salina.3